MQTLSHAMTHHRANTLRANSRWHPYTPPRSSSAASTPNHAPLYPVSESHLHIPVPSSSTISPASVGVSSRYSSPAVPLPPSVSAAASKLKPISLPQSIPPSCRPSLQLPSPSTQLSPPATLPSRVHLMERPRIQMIRRQARRTSCQ